MGDRPEIKRDLSRGWDDVVDRFAAIRSDAGRDMVTRWARMQPPGSVFLDIGAGHGWPITSALIEEGCQVYAVDAAPRMVEAFRARLPDTPILCEPVETSSFFGRLFDAIAAIGIVFLLDSADQHRFFARVSAHMTPGGSLIFSAPAEIALWADTLTGRPSRSLGRHGYRRTLAKAGLTLIEAREDAAGNHYFIATKGIGTGAVKPAIAKTDCRR